MTGGWEKIRKVGLRIDLFAGEGKTKRGNHTPATRDALEREVWTAVVTAP